MSEPFVGEIRMFAGNFTPRGWAFCDGQLIGVAQNDALFSLLGTTYGGDGRTTFGLPDMRGRIPIHQGWGPGLSNRRLGSKSGQEGEILSASQIGSHTHTSRGTTGTGTANSPDGAIFANPGGTILTYKAGATQRAAMNADAIGHTGGSQEHDNVQPFVCVNFIVALFGIYPSRS